MMSHMMGGMFAMGIIGILLVIFLVLGIAALINTFLAAGAANRLHSRYAVNRQRVEPR